MSALRQLVGCNGALSEASQAGVTLHWWPASSGSSAAKLRPTPLQAVYVVRCRRRGASSPYELKGARDSDHKYWQYM